MASELRAVFDTNVTVSAVLLPRSVPRQAFDAVLERGTILISRATIIELDDVLRRPKFNRYVPEAERLEFLAALVREAEAVGVTETLAQCRDPQDDKFLELAVSGGRAILSAATPTSWHCTRFAESRS